jgi:hypothetical protein
MSLIALVLLVFPLQSPPAAAPAGASALIGQWESVFRTPEGVGNILEFQPGGRVTQISASMAEADYRVVDDRLVTTWKDPATGRIAEVETQVEFEGTDRFLEKSDDATGNTWSERVGGAPKTGSPLLGRWCFLFLESLTSYREFTSERMYNRMPVVVIRGTYAVDGDHLTVTMQNQPSGTYPFRLDGARLFIRSRDGSEREYKRPETSLLAGY